MGWMVSCSSMPPIHIVDKTVTNKQHFNPYCTVIHNYDFFIIDLEGILMMLRKKET